MNDRIATRQSWRIQEMGDHRDRLEPGFRFTADEFKRLRTGVIPESFDERWFAFYEDGWIYLHRSWTGCCVFQLRIEQEADGYVVREALFNRDFTPFGHNTREELVRRLDRILGNIMSARGLKTS